MKMIVSVGIICLAVLAIFVKDVEVVHSAFTTILILGAIALLFRND